MSAAATVQNLELFRNDKAEDLNGTAGSSEGRVRPMHCSFAGDPHRTSGLLRHARQIRPHDARHAGHRTPAAQ
jgi:hypothetical protein